MGIGPCPDDIVLDGYIEKFGVQAVLGRPTLSANEIKRIVVSTNVLTAYKSRESCKNPDGTPNWAKWAEANPDLANILRQAEIEAHG